MEAGGVGGEAEGSHVAQDGEGGGEETGMGGDAEQESVVRERERLRGGGEDEGHGGREVGE